MPLLPGVAMRAPGPPVGKRETAAGGAVAVASADGFGVVRTTGLSVETMPAGKAVGDDAPTVEGAVSAAPAADGIGVVGITGPGVLTLTAGSGVDDAGAGTVRVSEKLLVSPLPKGFAVLGIAGLGVSLRPSGATVERAATTVGGQEPAAAGADGFGVAVTSLG